MIVNRKLLKIIQSLRCIYHYHKPVRSSEQASERAREWERVERLQGKNMNEVVR